MNAPADPRPNDSLSEFSGLLWRPGAIVEEHPKGTQLVDTLSSDPRSMAWALIPRDDSRALREAAQRLQLDQLAIEDVLDQQEGIKLDWVGDTMVAVAAFVEYRSTDGDVLVSRVSLLADDRAVVVLADADVRQHIERHLRLATASLLLDGIPAAVHVVLDLLIDSCTGALSEMEDDLDALSEQLFDDRPMVKADQLRAFRLRRALARFRKIAAPLRTVAVGLSNAAARSVASGAPTDPAERLLGDRSAREFADIADHATRNADNADSLRDVIGSLFETNLALADVHLNQIMKKLSGWAAIIAVPTLITGFLGMNVPYPGFGTTAGVIGGVVALVVAVTVLYVMFRRKGWL